ncbi:MAG: hypothetical protein KDC98_04500 [Planctomycetes bacterium]|nr:hypothetical protein [Planctomycetota bacterium]
MTLAGTPRRRTDTTTTGVLAPAVSRGHARRGRDFGGRRLSPVLDRAVALALTTDRDRSSSGERHHRCHARRRQATVLFSATSGTDEFFNGQSVDAVIG